MQPELKKRVLVGVPGAIGLVSLIAFGGWVGTFVLAVAISIGMVVEFANISFTLPDRVEKRYVMISLAWVAALANALLPRIEFQLLTVLFFVLFTYFLFTAKRFSGPEFSTHFTELVYSLFGSVYLIFLPFYFLKIHDAGGAPWVILFLAIVWAGDTAAYFVGKKYGKKRLYPQISPKKTVEGALGGLAMGVFVTLVFRLVWIQSMSWGTVLFVPVVVGGAAQVGDLCESFFKRAYDKKDSGSIIPGHGGFLDRFDGVVFALPVMYALMRLLS